jgi:hypothetical protein
MKKLKLRLDDLTIEGFNTLSQSSPEGTVVGNSATSMFPIDPSCWDCHSMTVCQPSNEPMWSCLETCMTRCGTCYC